MAMHYSLSPSCMCCFLYELSTAPCFARKSCTARMCSLNHSLWGHITDETGTHERNSGVAERAIKARLKNLVIIDLSRMTGLGRLPCSLFIRCQKLSEFGFCSSYKSMGNSPRLRSNRRIILISFRRQKILRNVKIQPHAPLERCYEDRSLVKRQKARKGPGDQPLSPLYQ